MRSSDDDALKRLVEDACKAVLTLTGTPHEPDGQEIKKRMMSLMEALGEQVRTSSV